MNAEFGLQAKCPSSKGSKRVTDLTKEPFGVNSTNLSERA